MPLGFNCGLFPPLCVAHPLGFAPEAALEDWGCPCEGRCGGGAAAWAAGVLAAPGPQGARAAGNMCSRRGWQPVLANTCQYSCLENPPDREAWQATVYRVTKSRTLLKQPCMHRCKTHCGSSAPTRAEREGGAAAWPAGTLVASVQGHGCLHHRSSGPIRAFFRASCSWPSEGLFGQSFSIAPPVQALRGLPCLGSFSVVWPIRHIEGPPDRVLLCSLAYQSLKGAPWVRSYSVVSPSGV